MTTHIPINIEKAEPGLSEKHGELFMEIKRWWEANFKEILNDERNKHLRRDTSINLDED